MKAHLLLFISFLFILSCSKDKEIIVSDNDVPEYAEIATVKVENYVNRIFIDLIGREALDEEMEKEVNTLKKYDLNENSRLNLIQKLQTDSSYLEGDSSYFYMFYHRLYDLAKVRILEGSSNEDIYGELYNQLTNAEKDSMNNDMLRYEYSVNEAEKLQDVIDAEHEYSYGLIEINEVYARMLDNVVYDEINMNTFNLVNATFDNLFFRFPTSEEFTGSFNMIEYNQPEILFSQSGQSKDDFIDIVTNSQEFYEGLIRWVYLSLLGREPSGEEAYQQLHYIVTDYNLPELYQRIMITDEYANF